MNSEGEDVNEVKRVKRERERERERERARERKKGLERGGGRWANRE